MNLPEEIQRLIFQGEQIIEQQEADKQAKHEAFSAEVRAAWDEINAELRARLPDAIQPYMQPLYNHDLPDSGDTFREVRIEIPGLAPIQTRVFVSVRQDEPPVYGMPGDYDILNSDEDEGLLRIKWYMRYGDSFHDLRIALAYARRLHIEAHSRLSEHIHALHQQPQTDPVYAPVEDNPALKPASERLVDLIREIVNQALADRE